MVAGLALRELWISFRLLAVLAAFAAAGVVVVFVRSVEPIAAPLPWLAGSLGLTAAFVAALAAWSFSAERRRGAAAWLVSRSVPRGAVLFGWLLAMATPMTIGLATVGTLGWLVVGGVDPAAYVTSLCAGFADLLLALSAGVLLGTILWRVPAAVLAALLVAAVGGLDNLGILAGISLPGDGLRLLAGLSVMDQPVTDALLAAGTSLLAAAALLVAALLAVERTDL